MPTFTSQNQITILPMCKNLIAKCLAVFFLIASLSVQAQNPLMLKSGNRIPEVNLESWVSGFSLHNEQSFDGVFYKILQFNNLPDKTTIEALSQGGVELLAYLPVNAYFVSILNGFNPGILINRNIVSVTDLLPQERIALALQENELPVYALRGAGRMEVVVTLFPQVNATLAANSLSVAGWEVVRFSGDGRILALELPISEVPLVAEYPFVQFIEPCDPPAEPDNNKGRTLHRATSSFNPSAGANDYDGTSVTVMLNDDGYIGAHIDFQGRIPNQFTSTTGADHGDHCAGTILGAGNLNPLAMGMAPAADLVVYNASNYPGFDSIYNQYQTMGIRITSTSYSDGCNAGYTNRAAMLDEQIRTMPELMHVFSAGNNGTQNCSYGAGSGWGNITGGHKMAKNAIAVANLNYRDELSSSSSRGPAHDGRIKPDVSAQGTNVFSTSENNTYTTKSGTSMACPGVAGTLALLYDAYQRNHGGTPHGILMKGILMNSADDLGNPGPDFKFGYGRINARRAVEIIEDTLYKTDLITTGDSMMYSLTIPSGTKEARFMLNWTDNEAAVNATKTLVNNLDLVITGPDSTWLPWVLNHLPNATTLNAPATRKADTLNNAEQITLANPTPGTYIIKIKGTAVPMGPQRFFLNWIVSEDEFQVTWPQGGSQFVPGDTTILRWDATPASQNFAMHYSTNNGTTWDTISTVIPADNRYFTWSIPALATGNVKVRLTRGTETFLTEPFTILGVPQNITINWVCADSMSLSWSAVTGATGYTVYRLGSEYMDSLTTVAASTAVLGGIPLNTTEWFAVGARGPLNANGRRSLAKLRNPGLVNCTYSFDVSVQEITEPKPVVLSSCQTIAPMTVKCIIKNTGAATVSNIPVRYRVNQGPVISETFTGTLNPGATANHSFATPFVPTGSGDQIIAVWTQLSNDQLKSNDTLEGMVKLASFPTVQIPFLETFETFTVCATANNCETNFCTLSAGWLNPDNSLYDHTDWLAYRGTTPSGNTGPSGDHTLGTTSGKYLYVESSYCFQKASTVITPCIDLTANTLPVLSFWYHMYGTGMGSLRVDVLVDGIWTEDIITPILGNQGNSWKNVLAPLDSYIGKIINLRFRAITGADYMSDMCLDDIGVVETIGITEEEAGMAMTLSPNPASDRVLVSGLAPSGGEMTFALLTLQGQMVSKISILQPAGVFSVDIPLDDIVAGMYLLRVDMPGSQVTRKLLITR